MSKTIVETALASLGCIMKDKVTGFKGMVATVAFDAYGCVQVILRPMKLNADGKTQDGEWFDFNMRTSVTTRRGW
jgi:hypothetical protein